MPNYKKLPAQSKYFNGPLYQRMLDDLHLAGMADRTIYGYIRAVRQLAEFSQLAPDQLTEEHVRRWLLHLKVEQQRTEHFELPFLESSSSSPALAVESGTCLPKQNCRTLNRCPMC